MLAGLGEGRSQHACIHPSHVAKELPQGRRPPANSLGWCLQCHGREIPSNVHPGEPEQHQVHLWGRKWENRVGQLGNAALRGALGFGKGRMDIDNPKHPCISGISQTHHRQGGNALQGVRSTVPASAPARSARCRRAARLRPPGAALGCDADVWVWLSAPTSEI